MAQELLFVPGHMCTPALFGPQAALADVAAISFGDQTRKDTIVGIARSILATAPARFSLAGLSMGGYIALAIVRLAPERVERLALLDTSARANAPERAPDRRALLALAERGGTEKAIAHLLPKLVHEAHLADTALVEVIRKMGRDTSLAAFKRQQAAMMGRVDSRPFLPAIACPTLVLVGREDVLTPVALAQEMAAMIPAAELVVVPECGHLPSLERPEAVNAALRAWLARGTRQGRAGRLSRGGRRGPAGPWG